MIGFELNLLLYISWMQNFFLNKTLISDVFMCQEHDEPNNSYGRCLRKCNGIHENNSDVRH